MEKGIVTQGLDLLDMLGFISKKNKRYQAIFLKELEEIVPPDSEQYIRIRKLYLDFQNNYTRSILRAVFGDIEHLM